MRLVLAVATVLLAAGCTSSGDGREPTTSSATPGIGDTATSSAPPPLPSASRTSGGDAPTSAAARALAGMSLRRRVGQLIMIDCPSTGVGDATRAAVTRYAVGSVILDGTTQSGSDAVRDVTRTLRGLAPKQVGLFVATDQEGGLVQRLQGPGFDRIPSGVQQGAVAPDLLQTRARAWGQQLNQAGVNLNLAPVLDVVPVGGGPNPPIGDLQRQYGSTPDAVTRHGLAFARGMAAAGVDATVKHFPGLGRVAGNTDTTSGVTDTVTTRNDPDLTPFRAAVRADVPFVMISTATYTRIDPDNPAAFSRAIITGMLRGDLDFHGVVISDDIGAARQVSRYSPGQRAVRFVAAGGDLVLTVVAGQAQEMTQALLAAARSDPGFRKLVDAAALRVLRAKQARGLLD